MARPFFLQPPPELGGGDQPQQPGVWFHAGLGDARAARHALSAVAVLARPGIGLAQGCSDATHAADLPASNTPVQKAPIVLLPDSS